MDKEHW